MALTKKETLTSEKAKAIYQKMVNRKLRLRKHLENGGKLSELPEDEFKFVKPL